MSTVTSSPAASTRSAARSTPGRARRSSTPGGRSPSQMWRTSATACAMPSPVVSSRRCAVGSPTRRRADSDLQAHTREGGAEAVVQLAPQPPPLLLPGRDEGLPAVLQLLVELEGPSAGRPGRRRGAGSRRPRWSRPRSPGRAATRSRPTTSPRCRRRTTRRPGAPGPRWRRPRGGHPRRPARPPPRRAAAEATTERHTTSGTRATSSPAGREVAAEPGEHGIRVGTVAVVEPVDPRGRGVRERLEHDPVAPAARAALTAVSEPEQAAEHREHADVEAGEADREAGGDRRPTHGHVEVVEPVPRHGDADRERQQEDGARLGQRSGEG